MPAPFPLLPRIFLALFFSLSPSPQLQATAGGEVQSHGLHFEKWVRETFFENYHPPAYTQKWDIPKEANRRYGLIPVNPKATEFGSPVGLGDALRQFDIDEPFLLIIGYWEERGQDKYFVKAISARVEPELWRKLWHPITRNDLLQLDAVVKNRSLDYLEARKQAQKLKNSPPFSDSAITLNPKIDAQGQRRLQCSLSYTKVITLLAPPGTARDKEPHPKLFGVPLPPSFHSPPRQFPSSPRKDSD